MARKADPTIRGRLLNAARAEFSEHGLDGARISTITSRAGVSKGAFYLHFQTKEHAFEEVARDFFNSFHKMMEGLDALVESTSDDDLSRLHTQLLDKDVEMMEFLWNERAFASILFEGAGSSKHCHLIEAFAARIQDQIVRLLGIDQKNGRIREDLNLNVVAAFIAGGFDRYARLLLSSSTKPDIRSDLIQLQGFVSRGVLTPVAIQAIESGPPPSSDTRRAPSPLYPSTDFPRARQESSFSSTFLPGANRNDPGPH